MKTLEGKKVEIPRYNKDLKTWHCPRCGRKIDIYDESHSYYYNNCDCGCAVATKNYMEENV